MSTPNSFNPWTYKPWWCQPWSIVLTGILLIGSSWLLTETIWVVVLVAIPVLMWMSYFILIWPQLVARYLKEQSQQLRVPDKISEMD